MRDVILTCKNHPDLRWICKEIAFNSKYGYNGCRHIFFQGTPSGEGLYWDGSGIQCTWSKNGVYYKECDCKAKDLILAPEDKLVHDVLWLRKRGNPVHEKGYVL